MVERVSNKHEVVGSNPTWTRDNSFISFIHHYILFITIIYKTPRCSEIRCSEKRFYKINDIKLIVLERKSFLGNKNLLAINK